MLKPLHTMAHIRILLLEESYYTTNYEPCRSTALQLGVVLYSNGGYTREDIDCTHSFTMKAYERSGERANPVLIQYV